MQLFWHKGFHDTSLKDLERALEMHPGSIYATFGSKGQLFQEALERYAHLALIELERTLAAHESPLAGLAAYLRQLGGLRDQTVPSRACMLVKSLLELGEREKDAREKAEALLTTMEGRFIDSFAKAQQTGELDEELDPTRLGRRLQAEVMGLRSFAQRDVDSAAVHALADDMASSLEALRSSAH
ncbi:MULTISPECIES: helix-turn-helix domain-containing protein [unclassified Halomonas]|uniref:TetR/AcrR family transcriptional regulator n=1 Tax=unclassified Halomonas TaxID=2609666 RepID=UPI0028841E33|nr:MULTISPECIES: helix-turn-helix domain-containing protein [unclassified Halomonas]MDT0499988.1 helix-turn-helix domain-containing protein [Halomonas sp. PAR7]MDT0512392.1 helix-turn-helix domain-containing protein [Halomonas sp. LES1]MDT0591026.1 helix-turn-helix domain-containing protein [Halomonas sp. PAR8]